MNIFEYIHIISGCSINMDFDESGNGYIYDVDKFYGADVMGMGEVLESLKRIVSCSQGDVFFIEKNIVEKLKEYQLLFEEESFLTYDCLARRPYYRMRGKPVTKEQAFEIICRTDGFFLNNKEICNSKKYMGSINFDNCLIEKNHYLRGYGWVHADGTIGVNAITQKYPNVPEFIAEWMERLIAFPYLDLIIAVTYWDEIPMEAWEDSNYDFEKKEYDSKFYDAVEIGIYVHDRKIEILKPEKTVEKYKEYAELYENGNDNIYRYDYYEQSWIE